MAITTNGAAKVAPKRVSIQIESDGRPETPDSPPDAQSIDQNRGHGDPRNFYYCFENLSYVVKNSWIKRSLGRLQGRKVPKETVIFSNLTSVMATNMLIGIMGPSGAGKSTLLECLAHRKIKGRTGRVYVSGGVKRVKISYIPQHDNYYDVLSVRECIIFASKLQNSTKKFHGSKDYLDSVISSKDAVKKRGRRMTISHRDFHEVVADDIIKMLGLDNCADVSCKSISGGQKKRLSIAQELVSKPNVLLLDEPTSGLDSAACWSLIQVLYSLVTADPPMLICCTIHQPNAKIFNAFHKILMLSVSGKIIFDNFPETAPDTVMKELGINCPELYNPGDLLSDIAAGEYGLEKIREMAENRENMMRSMTPLSAIRRGPIFDARIVSKPPKFPKFKHFRFLLHRSFILIMRDPMLTTLEFLMHLLVALFVGYMYGPRIGKVSGCPPDISASGFDPQKIASIRSDITLEIRDVMDNLSNLFFNCLIVFFGSLMPTLLTFPLEMSIFVKEKTNGWYGTGIYYLAKTAATIPFQFIFPTIYVLITYGMNNQPRDLIRFGLYLCLMILTGILGQSFGLIFGAFFMDDPVSAVFIAPIAVLPTFLFSGFLVKIENMPLSLRFFSRFSWMRYAMEGIIITIYGFRRCVSDPRQMLLAKHVLTSWMTGLFRDSMDPDDYGEYGYWSGLDDRNHSSPLDPKELGKSVVDSLLSGVGGKNMVDPEGNAVSGVMSIFSLREEKIIICFVALVVNVVILRIFTYILIRWRGTSV